MTERGLNAPANVMSETNIDSQLRSNLSVGSDGDLRVSRKELERETEQVKIYTKP